MFYAAIIILFFFPFCELKCGSEKINTINGVHLVTGKEYIGNENYIDNSTKNRLPSNTFAVISLAAPL